MSAVVRQPFAPLDGSRLQQLTSLKNRQNVLPPSPPSAKRKASDVADTDDLENMDPTLFTKRSKGLDASSCPTKPFFAKPSSYVLTTKATTTLTPTNKLSSSLGLVTKAQSTPSKRPSLKPKSRRLDSAASRSPLAPRSAPIGRSPTLGTKRAGLLSKRRRTAAGSSGPAAAAVPFSLDSALSGTIPTYGRSAFSHEKVASKLFEKPVNAKASWFFDIHEDTPEQEMTNMLQHSTCILDISSDEETELKVRRERAEGRDKENVPPPSDISQTYPSASLDAKAPLLSNPRGPLAEMKVSDYYSEGDLANSFIIVPGDEDDDNDATDHAINGSTDSIDAVPVRTTSAPAVVRRDAETKSAVDMALDTKTEDFTVWESGSAQGDTEAPPSPAPAAEVSP